MKHTFLSVTAGMILAGAAMLFAGQNTRTERETHPRLAAAIAALKDARAYLEAAPHDFGGHKADAIRSTNQAIRDLNEALRYRAKEDRGR